MQNQEIAERQLSSMASPYSIHPSSTKPHRGSFARSSGALALPRFDLWRAFLVPLVAGALLGALVTLAFQAAVQNRPDSSGGAVRGSPSATVQASNLQITMRAELLAALIQDAAARSRIPLQLENVRVQTGSDQLTVTGDVPVPGGSISGSAVFQPYVADGRLAMHVLRAQFGALPIPDDIVLLTEGPINDRIAAASSGLPATITSVRVDETGVTVGAHVSTDRR